MKYVVMAALVASRAPGAPRTNVHERNEIRDSIEWWVVQPELNSTTRRCSYIKQNSKTIILPFILNIVLTSKKTVHIKIILSENYFLMIPCTANCSYLPIYGASRILVANVSV